MKLARCRSEFYVTVETRLGVLSVEVLVEEHWLECLSLDQVFARLLLVVLGSIFYPYACCWLPLLSHWYTPNWNIITLPGPGPGPPFAIPVTLSESARAAQSHFQYLQTTFLINLHTRVIPWAWTGAATCRPLPATSTAGIRCSFPRAQPDWCYRVPFVPWFELKRTCFWYWSWWY